MSAKRRRHFKAHATLAIALATTLTLTLVAPPASAADPVSISSECSYGKSGLCVWSVTVTSRTEKITLQNVIFNRGVCTPHAYVPEQPPIKLGFGMRVRAILPGCVPIEVEVVTDLGNFIFNSAPTADPVFVWRGCSYGVMGQCTWVVTVTATEDTTLQEIVVNRRACKPAFNRGQKFPATFGFGRTIAAYLACTPIEVEVVTDQGSFTFPFDD
jgi:hypothetical protein